VAGREGKRGECQTGLGLVWREMRRSPKRPPPRPAASTRKRAEWKKGQRSFPLENDGWLLILGLAYSRHTQEFLTERQCTHDQPRIQPVIFRGRPFREIIP